jgi:putative ABC transport system permease protein
MRHLHIAELRGSWRAWLSVGLAFVVTNAAVALSLLAWEAGQAALARGDMTEFEAAGTNFLFLTNAVLCALVAIPVLSSAAELVVASRRAGVARLALAGAAPRQIIGTLTTQLTAVSLVAAVVGGAIAVALLRPVMSFVTLARSSSGDLQGSITPVITPMALVASTLVCVGVAVIGGYGVAARAAAIPVVEALRQAASEPPARRSVVRLVAGVLTTLLTLAVAIGTLVLMGQNDLQKGDQIVQGGLVVLLLTGIALWFVAPFLVGLVTRGWTALVPLREPAWQLATRTVIARNVRLSRSVTPVMMTVGVLVGMLLLGATIRVLIIQQYGEDAIVGSSLGALLMVLGLPFLVSLSGAVGNLVMMARQRDAEVALAGIAGATPRQQTTLLILEGVIVAVTGVVLGLVMVAAAGAYVYVGLRLYSPIALIEVPWLDIALVTLGCIAVCSLATTLPSIAALRQPPQRVVAQLIAD